MSPLLEIIALTREGRWDEAHKLVQGHHSRSAAWLHGVLHVQEGDLANAEFWYSQAGRDFRGRGSVGEELDALETRLHGPIEL